MAHVLEEALDQEVFPQGEGVPWGSMEEGVHHDTVAFQGEGVSAYPCGRDLQNKKKYIFTVSLLDEFQLSPCKQQCQQRLPTKAHPEFGREFQQRNRSLYHKQTNKLTNKQPYNQLAMVTTTPRLDVFKTHSN